MGNYVKNVAEVKLIGRLTRDLEQKFIPSGASVVNTCIAINKSKKNKVSDEWETETDFFNIIIWGNVGEMALLEVKKGMLVQIDGRLKNRTWEKKDGTKSTITEVVANSISQIGSTPEIVSEVKKEDKVSYSIEEEDIPF